MRAAASVLIGIDVVEVDRVRAAIADIGPLYLRRVCTARERAAIGADPERAAAAVAVKECLIKAIGGRPTPFDWRAFETHLHRVRPVGRIPGFRSRLLPALPALVRAVRTAAGVRGLRAAPCTVRTVVGRMRGLAVWGRTGGLLVAVAVLSMGTP